MKVIRKIGKKIKLFYNNRKQVYYTYPKSVINWFKNRKLQYKILNIEQAKEYKTSDTIFILGSGPSINELEVRQWEHIKKHDTFGINFSFVMNHAPTFHSMEDGKTPFLRSFIQQRISERKTILSKSVWCISDRHLSRLIHPRITPEFFPENPVCLLYEFPETMDVYKDENIKEEEFETKSIIYRGSLSVALYLADKLKYKKIVLLGVDLDNPSHFYEKLPEMKEYMELHLRIHGKPKKYETMIPNRKKSLTMDKYLIRLNNKYFKKKNIEFFVQNETSILYPMIKSYHWGL